MHFINIIMLNIVSHFIYIDPFFFDLFLLLMLTLVIYLFYNIDSTIKTSNGLQTRPGPPSFRAGGRAWTFKKICSLKNEPKWIESGRANSVSFFFKNFFRINLLYLQCFQFRVFDSQTSDLGFSCSACRSHPIVVASRSRLLVLSCQFSHHHLNLSCLFASRSLSCFYILDSSHVFW